MDYLSDRINAVAESQTLAMAQKSRELKERGLDIINLSIGEPDFNTPDDIKEAAKTAIDNNFTTYPPVAGYADLREAISRKFKEENGLDYKPSQVVVSAGGKHSLMNVILCLINPGDEVIIPAPYWVSYYEQVIFAEGKPVVVSASIDNNFKITPAQLEAAITPRTRLVIFNSPSNPTGMVYSKEEMEALARVVAKYEGLFIMSDEIYEHITFEGEHISMASFDFIYDRVITVNGVSKGYAMTGWRIGYIGAPKWIADACIKLQGQFTSGVGSISQRAALAAITSKGNSREIMREQFRKRRDIVCGLLAEIPGLKIGIPDGAFYVFPDISSFIGKSNEGVEIKDSDDLALFLLDKAQVATVGGTGFGAPDCLRLSYAASEKELKTAIERIKKALALLK